MTDGFLVSTQLIDGKGVKPDQILIACADGARETSPYPYKESGISTMREAHEFVVARLFRDERFGDPEFVLPTRKGYIFKVPNGAELREADKETMRNFGVPMEVRRAALIRHNRRLAGDALKKG